LTLNTSESPSAAVECSLSDVLETQNVPAKYLLSAKACEGILRRAERRGKKLPEMLDRALRSVLATHKDLTLSPAPTLSPLSESVEAVTQSVSPPSLQCEKESRGGAKAL